MDQHILPKAFQLDFRQWSVEGTTHHFRVVHLLVYTTIGLRNQFCLAWTGVDGSAEEQAKTHWKAGVQILNSLGNVHHRGVLVRTKIILDASKV